MIGSDSLLFMLCVRMEDLWIWF